MKAKRFFKKFASWHLWLNLLGMGVLVVVLMYGLKWWLLKYTHHGEAIEVPNLTGMDYRKAVSTVEELGLQIMISDSTYIKDQPAGSILAQMPESGMGVKEGRVIYVTINALSIPKVRIPDLANNSSYRNAVSILKALDLRVAPPKIIEGEQDWVYRLECDGREVRTGDLLARESTITLVIGKGSPEDTYNDYGYDDDPEMDDYNISFDDDFDDDVYDD